MHIYVLISLHIWTFIFEDDIKASVMSSVVKKACLGMACLILLASSILNEGHGIWRFSDESSMVKLFPPWGFGTVKTLHGKQGWRGTSLMTPFVIKGRRRGQRSLGHIAAGRSCSGGGLRCHIQERPLPIIPVARVEALTGLKPLGIVRRQWL